MCQDSLCYFVRHMISNTNESKNSLFLPRKNAKKKIKDNDSMIIF